MPKCYYERYSLVVSGLKYDGFPGGLVKFYSFFFLKSIVYIYHIEVIDPQTLFYVDPSRDEVKIDWTKERDAKLLHSIGYYTDFSYIIGYKSKNFSDFENGPNLKELSSPAWKQAKKSILNQFDFDKEDILQEPSKDLFPAILVKSKSFERIERLMNMDELHYIEPQIDIFLLRYDLEFQAKIELEYAIDICGDGGALPVGNPFVSHTLNPLGISDGDLCNACFGGFAVDFAVIMQDNSDANDNRTTLTVTCSGDEPEYSTGSSSATGTFSGMAALVWSRLGASATRQQVLDRMKAASSTPAGNHKVNGFDNF